MSSLFLCIVATKSSMMVSKTALFGNEYSIAICKRSQTSSVVHVKSLFDLRVRCASQNLSLSLMKSVKNVEKVSDEVSQRRFSYANCASTWNVKERSAVKKRLSMNLKNCSIGLLALTILD